MNLIPVENMWGIVGRPVDGINIWSKYRVMGLIINDDGPHYIVDGDYGPEIDSNIEGLNFFFDEKARGPITDEKIQELLDSDF